jgi:hypothetical protein
VGKDGRNPVHRPGVVAGEGKQGFKEWGGDGPGYEVDFIAVDVVLKCEDAFAFQRVVGGVICVHGLCLL